MGSGMRATVAAVRYSLGTGETHVFPSLNTWQYRRWLSRLDTKKLRGLAVLGAETPRVLALWANDNDRMGVDVDRTGIASMTAATASDWANLAWRRGVVEPWPGSEEESFRSTDPDAAVHLTDRGREVLRPVWHRATTRLQGVFGLVGLSGLTALYVFLANNPSIAGVIGVFAAYAAIIILFNLAFTSWIRRRPATGRIGGNRDVTDLRPISYPANRRGGGPGYRRDA
jgi:hypothetical protein